ncbi:hypothetical protein QA584_22570 [Anaerocolumna sp. AGMB13025]|uniref:hypothetical protein n=1 Tax=Anaerocolumna sp. AGMB13025 TaxID=3039116 RepID=UPI00241F29DD|nr:hypothetical protein [Anaerocolumna sp. AGMB13025]WFR56370.1 hypothetical protein QA584_22570 [Anaerocolumna sp. AGMB13025]
MKKVLSMLMTFVILFSLALPANAEAAVKISKTSLTLTVGNKATLKITGTTKEVKWSTSKKSVATVSKGKVIAKKAGSTTITGIVEGKKYTCKVKVVDKKTASVESISDVVDFLKDKGYIKGNETKMDASMIGGISGVKYKDSKIEIYEYDTNSDTYKSLVKTNKVMIEGLNIEMTMSAVNGKFALYCEEADNKDDIIKTFNSLSVE